MAASRPTLIPISERKAAAVAARAAIDESLRATTEAVEKQLVTAQADASNALAELQATEAKTDAEVRAHVAKAFVLQAVPLAAELIKHETRACALDLRSKYRTLQAEAVKFCGRELPLMPLMLVGQVLIARSPETKPRIARVATVASPYSDCAGSEIAAAHAVLMAESPDDLSVRDALLNLERRLVAISASAASGDFSDEIWDGIKQGLTQHELDELWRDLGQPAERARLRAAAFDPAVHKTTYGKWIRTTFSQLTGA